MKSGASDPFADDGPDEDEDDEVGDPASETRESPEAATSTATVGSEETSTATVGSEETSTAAADSRGTPTTEMEAVESGANTGTEHGTSSRGSSARSGSTESGGLSRSELPFVLRRERVKDERPEVHQLFVQQETHDAAVEAERELQDRLDDDLARTDAREAIYRAGMAHLDDAEDILRTWGYDL